MSLMLVVTVLGWVGALAGLVAYAMVSRGRWSADSMAFQGTNMLAAGTLLTVAAANGIWPSAASNLAAILIGVNAVYTVVRAKRRAAKEAAAQAPVLTVVEDVPPVQVPDHVPAGLADRMPATQPAVGYRAYAEAA
ncbi:CBU_0592 family membrane protein [Promicromonospora sukumoe]